MPLLGIIAALVFIPLIGNCPLFDWDEINFAECAREMIVTGNYTTVQINFNPFWEKPPFFIWLQALSMNVFGVNEFAARLPNAICGIFTIITLYLVGKKLFNAKFGLTWAIIHTGTLLPHLYFKSGLIDPWFNFFILLSVLLFVFAVNLETTKQLIYFTFSGILLGVAVLTKGPAALLVEGLSIFIYLIFSKKLHLLANTKFYYFLLIIIITSISWFAFEYITGNKQIIKSFIDYQIRLFNTEDSGHSGPIFYHVVVLLLGCFPTSILFINSYRNNYRLNPIQKETRLIVLILFWVVLVLFSIVKTKIVHYSSLCYVPISFIATLGIYNKRNEIKKSLLSKFLFILITLLFFIAFLAFTQINKLKPYLFKYNLIGDEFAKLNLNAELIWLGYEWLIPFLFLVASIFIYRSYFLGKTKNILFGYTFQILFIVSAINVFVPKAELISQQSAISFYKHIAKQDAHVETHDFKSYAYIFYANRKPEHYNNPEQVKFIEDFYKYQNKNFFKLNFFATANVMWMKTGIINKPAYIVCKTPAEKDFLQYPEIKKLYDKNGFSFFVRMPKHDK